MKTPDQIIKESELSLQQFDTFSRAVVVELVKNVGKERPGCMTLKSISSSIGLSGNCVIKYLAAEGVRFLPLVWAVKYHFAVNYFLSGIHVNVAAKRLDYAHRSCMIKAFRQWTGMNPGQFKKLARGE